MAYIIFATCNELPEILPSDRCLEAALKARGHEVTGAPWNGPFEKFTDADMVIVRSTWDYFDCLDDYFAWIAKLETAGTILQNSPDILRWNAKKDYLFELEQKDLPVIETARIADGSTATEIQKLLQDRKWTRGVLKCLCSGGAKGLSVIQVDDLSSIEAGLKTANPWSEHGLMLQRYLPHIENEGELSIIWFGGKFSHAVRKQPKAGEFRVQSEFGGQYSLVEIDAETLRTSEQILEAAPGMSEKPPAYARIDGVMIDGQFQLMEMELTEPELMLDLSEGAAERLADVIETRL